MKVYEVECRAVITLAEEDIARAASQGAAFIRRNPHLIQVKSVHERDRGLAVTGKAEREPQAKAA